MVDYFIGVRICALYRNVFGLSGNYEHLMKDYSSPQSPTLATRESFCFTAEDQTHARDPTDGLNLAIFIILAFIVILLLLGTFLELFPSHSSKENTLQQLVMSFSLVTNTTTLLSTKSGSGRLDSMNGMK